MPGLRGVPPPPPPLMMPRPSRPDGEVTLRGLVLSCAVFGGIVAAVVGLAVWIDSKAPPPPTYSCAAGEVMIWSGGQALCVPGRTADVR